MTNEQLIRSAHIWAILVLLACTVVAVGVGAGSMGDAGSQNANSTTSKPQDSNSNKNSNRKPDNTTTTGDRVAMAAMSSQDKDFVMEAAMGGLMEVDLGRIAAQQGSTDAVKQFGQRMVDDHSKVNSELASLASTKGITVPAELDEKHRNEVTKMSKLTGAEFDRAYSKMMLNDHVKDVAAFEKQSKKATDPDLKAFAAKTLPTLQEHLQMAKALTSTSGATKNRNSNSNRP
jgi:putative membrane protein